MKKLTLLFSALVLCLQMPLLAQTDVTGMYLSNADFETSPTGHATDSTIYDIDGWTEVPAAGSISYLKMGTVAYGSTINIGDPNDVPANGSSVMSSNNTLLVTKMHWYVNSDMYVEQTATLPAGEYTITWDSYMLNNADNAISRCGVVIDGTATYDALPTSLSTWKNHSLTFLVTEEKAISFRMGQHKSVDAGGSDSPVLYVDNLKLYSNPIDKTDLQILVDSANTMNSTREAMPDSAKAYSDLVSAINEAQLVLDDAGADVISITNNEDSMKMVLDYLDQMLFIQERSTSWTTNQNITSIISEPSFNEGFGTWSNPNGMARQSNTSYVGKEGSHYVEKWQSSTNGSWTNLSLSQEIKSLPNGFYKVSAAAFCSGLSDAYVFANNSEVEVITNNTVGASYSVKTEIDNHTLTIGYRIGSASTAGNYIGCDNFRLTFLTAKDAPAFVFSAPSFSMDAITPTATVDVEGYYLSDDVTFTAPSGFSVDLASIVPTDGMVAPTTVTITFDALATSSGYVVFASGSTADSVYVEGTAEPSLLVSEPFLVLDDLNTTATFTVTGGNLTEDISITAPNGFSVDNTTVDKDSGEETITVTFDATVESRGDLSIISSGITKSVRVLGFMNFTPKYPTGNLVSDPYLTSLTNFSDGWFSSNHSITTDTLEIYSGRSSYKAHGTGVCYPNGTALIDNLGTALVSDTYYLLRSMVKTVDGTFNFVFSVGYGVDPLPVIDTENNWEQYEYVYLTGTVGSGQELMFSNCDGSGLTGMNAFLDNYELYKMPIYLSADSISFDGIGDSIVNVKAQLPNTDAAFAITAPAGIGIDATTVAADGTLALVVSFDNGVSAEGFVVFDNGTYADSVYVKAEKSTVTLLKTNAINNDKVYVNNSGIIIDFTLDQASEVNFTVYNLQGAVINTQTSIFTAGNQLHMINTPLNRGIFFVKVTKGMQVTTYKVLK